MKHCKSVVLLLTTAVSACSVKGTDEGGSTLLKIISVGAEKASRTIVEGTSLPQGEATKGIGLFLLDKSGSDYDGIASGYGNILYSPGKDGWSSAAPIKLSGTEGILYSYFPYNPGVTDITEIPVEASLNGTDYMYGEPVEGVNSGNREVSILLKHALSRISVSFVADETYSGAGQLSALTLEGGGVASAGTLDGITGNITSESGKVAFETDSKISSDGSATVEECLVVPSGEAGAGDVTLGCTIDGREYSIALSGDKGVIIGQGIHSEVVIAVSDEQLRVLDVWAGRWEDGAGTQVTLDGKRTVRIELSDNIIQGDIIYRAYPELTGLTIKAFSRSSKSLVCTVPENCVCTPSFDRNTGVFSFIISDFQKTVTAVLGYPDDEKVLAKVRKDVMDTVSYAFGLFLDGGIGLDCGSAVGGYVYKVPLAAQRRFDATRRQHFYVVDSKKVKADTTKQMALFTGDDLDRNGILLYPDGKPRFRMLYIHGSTPDGGLVHAGLLADEAKENIRTFFNNGGSIVTSGAGGSMLVGNRFGGEYHSDFLCLMDWNTIASNGSVSKMDIVSGSILSSYGTFSSSTISVSNPTGVFLDENQVTNTEVLGRYQSSKNNYGSAPYIWSAKPSAVSGRIVSCGGKPEQDSTEGSDAFKLFTAELNYAADGNGCASVKGVLHNGEPVYMDNPMDGNDDDPTHSVIGDRQCHYFVLELDRDADRVELELNWSNPVGMELYMRKDNFAFPGSEGSFMAASTGDEIKEGRPLVLELENITRGLWYVTVRCSTSPGYQTSAISAGYGTYYTLTSASAKDGSRETLNGIPYSVMAYWTY